MADLVRKYTNLAQNLTSPTPPSCVIISYPKINGRWMWMVDSSTHLPLKNAYLPLFWPHPPFHRDGIPLLMAR
jgi:hypothetical protein